MSNGNGNGNGAPSEKMIARIRKLLALTKDRGATEAEASVAAAKAAEIMEEYGLTMMAVENSGGEAEGRDKEHFKNDIRWHFYEPLMKAVAESSYCYLEVVRLSREKRFQFTLIGRQSSVVSAKVLYEYLKSTIHRLAREAKGDGAVELLFAAGASERIVERLHDRHVNRLREQKEEVEARRRQQEAARQHPSSSSTALTVTLEDYEQREKDLNYDHLWGRRPGTTAMERKEREQATAAAEARYRALVAQGIEDGVAWNMVYMKMDRARAEEYQAKWERDQAKAQKRNSKWTKGDEERWHRDQARRKREDARKSSSSWTSGRAAGEKVGLDQQVGGNQERKKLS